MPEKENMPVNKYNILAVMIFLLSSVTAIGQTKSLNNLKSKEKSRLELSFSIGYSKPLLEAYGNNVTVNANGDQIFIDGKRLIVSDNLGANTGYSVQAYLKYSLLKKGYIKGLVNLGYNMLTSSYAAPGDYDIGTRVQTFSAGLGGEINPLGHEKKFYPGVYGLLRMNLVGGESYYAAGLDFFKVTPRFGYSAGIKLNYEVKKNIALHLGYSYSYDNLWSRQTEETTPVDDHVIVFRDKKSDTNGLTHDRRIAYWSLYMGMNFFFN